MGRPVHFDLFYGRRYLCLMCSWFIRRLFSCPPDVQQRARRLHHFIAFILWRGNMHDSVVFGALILLQRLKSRFPAARGSSGQRLFLAAYIVASKVLCDSSYSNSNWRRLAQYLFTLREINAMERELCSHLDWDLNFHPVGVEQFKWLLGQKFRSYSIRSWR
ncbi:hypothetical protein C8R43DRAFT_883675 [Mycena crocata]|nr:hypothetical protein C8R43DRAFT_883675 [Mycena crocata]